MRNFVRPGRALPVLLPLLAALPAHGQLLTNLSIGNPKGLALANAVTADPPGIDSIHFNPASLARIQGRQMNLKLLVAEVDVESRFGEPIKPTAEEKEVYYAVNEQCQIDYPAADAAAHSQCWGIDPEAGQTTQSGDPIVMIPVCRKCRSWPFPWVAWRSRMPRTTGCWAVPCMCRKASV